MEGAKDPDEFVLKYGKEAYVEFFESHMMDANQYLFETVVRNKNLYDANVIDAVKNEVFGIIQQMTSQTEIEDYLTRFAKILNTSLEALKKDFESFRGNHAIPQGIDMYPNPPAYDYPMDFGYDYPAEVKEKEEIEKKKWNSKCELRLFMYARSNKELALEINQRINDYLNAFSVDSQRLWIKLIDEYYMNFDLFEEGKFVNILDPESDLKYYLEIIEELRGDVNPYTEVDLNLCIEKIKQISIDQDQKMIQKRIEATPDVTVKSRLIDEKFRKKRTKETLKNRRK